MKKLEEEKRWRKEFKKELFVCLMAAIGGICYYVAKPRTTRGRQDEVQQIVEPSRESQGEPDTQTTTENNKVEATQPEVESYNDSIAPTHKSEGATEATTTTGTTYNKVVAEDNSQAVAKADEEIQAAKDNGAVVEDKETGYCCYRNSTKEPAVEEEKETQKRVDLDISQAVDAVNENNKVGALFRRLLFLSVI